MVAQKRRRLGCDRFRCEKVVVANTPFFFGQKFQWPGEFFAFEDVEVPRGFG